ncbi:MAG: FISUMP domain-containing protein [Bacteroidota bacterium]
MKYYIKILVSLIAFATMMMGQQPTIRGTPKFTCGSTITYTGRTYHTVRIGSQCWLKENLDVGTMIDSNQIQTDNGVIEKYCYNNDTAKCTTYGGLYQWDEAMKYHTTDGSQGICPAGWHIPTYLEFNKLLITVNYDINSLKAVGQGKYQEAGTNTSGFSALVAVDYDYGSNYDNLVIGLNIWTSTGDDSVATTLKLYPSKPTTMSYFSKSFGFGVRCIKNNFKKNNE